MMDLITKINDLIDKEFESVKSESADYREMKNSLEKMKKDIAWENSNIAEYIGERFRKLLDKEVYGTRLGQKSTVAEKKTKLILEGVEEYKAGVREVKKEILELKKTAEETIQTLERLTESGKISGEPHG